MFQGIAQGRSPCCGVRGECCSRATCASMLWASVTPSALRVWRKAVPVSADLPVLHSMLPGSVMANLSPVMRQRVSAISTAKIQSTCINSDRQLDVPIRGPVGRLLLSSLRTLGDGLITLGRSADSEMGSDTVAIHKRNGARTKDVSGRAIDRGSSRAYRISSAAL